MGHDDAVVVEAVAVDQVDAGAVGVAQGVDRNVVNTGELGFDGRDEGGLAAGGEVAGAQPEGRVVERKAGVPAFLPWGAGQRQVAGCGHHISAAGNVDGDIKDFIVGEDLQMDVIVVAVAVARARVDDRDEKTVEPAEAIADGSAKGIGTSAAHRRAVVNNDAGGIHRSIDDAGIGGGRA